MTSSSKEFDFWYAVNHTEVVEMPTGRLETFGSTLIRYHLLTEPMDTVGQVRVREGRIQAFRPEILTPQTLTESPLENFETKQANDFIQWLKQHESDLMLLKYGFKIRYENASETLIHDDMDNVLDRVQSDLKAREDSLSALVLGVDEPWEVCLLKLLVEVVRQSAPGNALDLRSDPDGRRHQIDRAFRMAARDRAQLAPLADLLKGLGKFEEYEDRFYALVRALGPG